jgi:hypothetical protein
MVGLTYHSITRITHTLYVPEDPEHSKNVTAPIQPRHQITPTLHATNHGAFFVPVPIILRCKLLCYHLVHRDRSIRKDKSLYWYFREFYPTFQPSKYAMRLLHCASNMRIRNRLIWSYAFASASLRVNKPNGLRITT